MHIEPGTLYLVSTPIGNLGDISSRALETLQQVQTIYAEDTRRTQVLTRHFGIGARLVSLHAHNERSRVAEVTAVLQAGDDCALVTDAGTPGVSDPGATIVRSVAAAGLPVVAIPGASAVLTALAVSGFPSDQFLFLGFPPRKGRQRREWLNSCVEAAGTVVVFESPRRLAILLADLVGLGLGATEACIARELTKLHEEVRRGTLMALADYYEGQSVRGEVTLVIDRSIRAGETDPASDRTDARKEAARLAEAGASTKKIAQSLRDDYGLARNEAYQMALRASQPADDEGVNE